MTTKEFNEIVDNYSDNVYRFILKNVKDKEKAKDIVQDSFEKLWINKNLIEIDKVKTYLFTTAYHTMIDGIRKDKRNIKLDEKKEKEQSHSNQYSDLQEILHNAINKLPEDQKAVILLRDYEGYSYGEISKITGLTEAQVKVYIYRGRVFLKDFIKTIENVI